MKSSVESKCSARPLRRLERECSLRATECYCLICLRYSLYFTFHDRGVGAGPDRLLRCSRKLKVYDPYGGHPFPYQTTGGESVQKAPIRPQGACEQSR